MSQFQTARGSIDEHIAQLRKYGFPSSLAGALDDGVNTLSVSTAGMGFRLFANLKTQFNLLSGLTTGASLAGGVLLGTIPGAFKPTLALITGTLELSAATATLQANAEIGLGTVIGSGAAATLGAVGATSENIVEGVVLGAMGAASIQAVNGSDDSRGLVGTLGSSTPVYLNFASLASGTAATNVLFSGQVSIWGILADHLN